jgi:hypothetical protein
VDFSEIGAFIDTPVKFYSSGMFVRLGFSVAVLADPDILLIDEVLAVGDMAFQMKCFERVEQIRAAGATIAVVSHNLNAVRRLCSRTIVIHDGELRFDGDTVEAIARYHELMGASDDPDNPMLANVPRYIAVAELETVELLGPNGSATRHIDSGTDLSIEAVVRFHRAFTTQPVLALTIMNEGGIHVYGETFVLPMGEGGYCDGDVLRLRVSLRPELATGSYSVQATISTFDQARLTPVSPPILFFATGRPGVRGIADMNAALTADLTKSMEPCTVPTVPLPETATATSEASAPPLNR